MSIPDCLVSNVTIAAALAVVAVLIGRLTRSPQIRHTLWLLVLVKLVTPPIVELPIASGMSGWFSTRAATELAESGVPQLPPASDRGEPQASDMSTASTNQEPLVRDTEAHEPQPADRAPPRTHFSAVLPSLLYGMWIAGTLVWISLAGIRVARFRCALRSARPASADLLVEIDSLAARYGCRTIPRVLIVDANIPPLMGSLGGRATMVLPSGLLNKLGATERGQMLAHELAHLRRLDHWLAWFAFAVTCIYWWNPLAWWARSKMHQAEEECCDAWVLSLFPNSASLYAQTLVDTVDFLTDSVAAPQVVTAFSPGRSLTRRVKLIVSNHLSPRVSWKVRAALAIVWIAVIPVSLAGFPTQARKEAKAPEQAALDQTARDHLVTVLGDNRLTHWDTVRWIKCPDAETIVSAGDDGAVIVWNRQDGSIRRGFYDVHSSAYATAANLCFMVNSKGELVRWSKLNDQTAVEPTDVSNLERRIVTCSPCGRFLAFGPRDAWSKGVSIWDRQTHTQLFSVDQLATASTFSPDSSTIVLVDDDKINEYETVSGKLLFQSQLPVDEMKTRATVYAAEFSETGHRLFIGDASGRLFAYSWPDRQLMEAIQFGGSTINDLSARTGHNGTDLFLASNNNCVDTYFSLNPSKWSNATAPRVVLNERSTAVFFGPEGKVVSIRDGRIVEMYGDSLKRLAGGARVDYTCFAFSPDGSRIALAGRDGQIVIRDTVKWEQVLSWRAHDNWVRTLAWSPRGNLLVSKADDYALAAWDPDTGAERRSYLEHSTPSLNTISFDEDGIHFACSCGDHFASHIVDAESLEIVAIIPRDEFNVRGDRILSRNGRRLYAGAWSSQYQVWSLDDNRVTMTAGNKTAYDVQLALTNDENVLFAAVSKTVTAYNIRDSKPLWTTKVHDGLIGDISLHPTRPLLATGGLDGQVSLVETTNGQILKQLRVGPVRANITQVDFSPNGELLAVAMLNGTVIILKPPLD